MCRLDIMCDEKCKEMIILEYMLSENPYGLLYPMIRHNEDAREVVNPEKIQEHHEICRSYIKKLQRGNEVFEFLEYLGNGKPGGEICLLTHEYAMLLLQEDYFGAERMERKIRSMCRKKSSSGVLHEK